MNNNFSTTPTKQGYFFSQPHQSFFLFGVLWAIIVMLQFALSYKGILVLTVSPIAFHAYSLIFIVFTQFFTGFIFTTFPRFCQSPVIERAVYTRIFFILQTGALLFVVGAIFDATVATSGMLLLFIANGLIIHQLQKIYNAGAMTQNSSDPFWILTGFYFGMVSHLLWLIDAVSNIGLTPLATQFGFLLYLIFVGFAIAQRMVPFFSHSFAEKDQRFVPVVLFLFILKSFLISIDLLWLEITVDLLLSLYLFREFKNWQLPIFSSPAILWVLHLALFWLPTAFFLGALGNIAVALGAPSAYFLQIHLLAIGFLTTLLIGFGTRVTLGHSGQPPHADRLVTNLFWFIQAVVVIRGIYSLQLMGDLSLNWFFDLSFTAWLILFIVWAWRYGPVLYRGKKIE
ncbi:MAG: NnrS family protein [Campylobacterota bacterium]|nr:NnrS family protein [Campylobacterota bacterium]